MNNQKSNNKQITSWYMNQVNSQFQDSEIRLTQNFLKNYKI